MNLKDYEITQFVKYLKANKFKKSSHNKNEYHLRRQVPYIFIMVRLNEASLTLGARINKTKKIQKSIKLHNKSYNLTARFQTAYYDLVTMLTDDYKAQVKFDYERLAEELADLVKEEQEAANAIKLLNKLL